MVPLRVLPLVESVPGGHPTPERCEPGGRPTPGLEPRGGSSGCEARLEPLGGLVQRPLGPGWYNNRVVPGSTWDYSLRQGRIASGGGRNLPPSDRVLRDWWLWNWSGHVGGYDKKSKTYRGGWHPARSQVVRWFQDDSQWFYKANGHDESDLTVCIRVKRSARACQSKGDAASSQGCPTSSVGAPASSQRDLALRKASPQGCEECLSQLAALEEVKARCLRYQTVARSTFQHMVKYFPLAMRRCKLLVFEKKLAREAKFEHRIRNRMCPTCGEYLVTSSRRLARAGFEPGLADVPDAAQDWIYFRLEG